MNHLTPEQRKITENVLVEVGDEKLPLVDIVDECPVLFAVLPSQPPRTILVRAPRSEDIPKDLPIGKMIHLETAFIPCKDDKELTALQRAFGRT